LKDFISVTLRLRVWIFCCVFAFGVTQNAVSAADSPASASASSPEPVVAKGYFTQTALSLGRDADRQGEVRTGRYFERSSGGGNIAGAWDMRDVVNARRDLTHL
jgi:hypothetical protein